MHLGIFLNLQLPQIIDLFLFNILITVLPYIDSCHIRNFQLSTEKNLQNGKYYKSRHCVPYQTFIWNALGFAQISDWTLTWVLLDVIVRVWFAIRVTGGSSARISILNPELEMPIPSDLGGRWDVPFLPEVSVHSNLRSCTYLLNGALWDHEGMPF